MEVRSPASGEVLGTVAEASDDDVRAAAAAAAVVQPAWAAVPAPARARYLRRAAQAVLDDLDPLATLIARETGRPRTEALLAELLPSVSGLHALADDGPAALADRRLGRPAALRGGRRAVLVSAPAGVVAIRGRPASPWAEPALEAAASLLAGNGVLLVPPAPLTGERLAAAFIRAGVPGELIAVLHGAAGEPIPAGASSAAGAGGAAADAAGLAGVAGARIVDLAADEEPKATMLVLDGAPVDAAVSGALWAAFAGAGRHPAAAGRLVVGPGPAAAIVERLVTAARRLRVGDPEEAATEIGPLASHAELAAMEAALAGAEAGGAERLCGGPVTVPGVGGAFAAPVVLRGPLREPAPGPVLAVLEAGSEAEAIGSARLGAGAVSVWAGDRGHGERVARALGAELAWVNEHGRALPSVPVRLARHVSPQRLASQPARLPSARRLPHDPALVGARTVAARVLHGREQERWAAVRSGALPVARTLLHAAARRSGRPGSNGGR